MEQSANYFYSPKNPPDLAQVFGDITALQVHLQGLWFRGTPQTFRGEDALCLWEPQGWAWEGEEARGSPYTTLGEPWAGASLNVSRESHRWCGIN